MLEDDSILLDETLTRGILPRGGTILRTSRTNILKRDDGPSWSSAPTGPTRSTG